MAIGMALAMEPWLKEPSIFLCPVAWIYLAPQTQHIPVSMVKMALSSARTSLNLESLCEPQQTHGKHRGDKAPDVQGGDLPSARPFSSFLKRIAPLEWL